MSYPYIHTYYIHLCTSNPALMAHKAIKLNGSSQNTQYFLWCIIYSERQREKERKDEREREREREKSRSNQGFNDAQYSLNPLSLTNYK